MSASYPLEFENWDQNNLGESFTTDTWLTRSLNTCQFIGKCKPLGFDGWSRENSSCSMDKAFRICSEAYTSFDEKESLKLLEYHPVQWKGQGMRELL